MKVERGAAFGVEVEWGLLPFLGDVASRVMDVLFSPRVSARTLIDNGSWGATVFEGTDRGHTRYWLGENVTNLLCCIRDYT